MKITKIFLALALSTGYISFVNAAVYPNLEVNLNKNIPTFNSSEIGLARLAITKQATLVRAMLIDAQSRDFPKGLVTTLEQQNNYYTEIAKRLIPNWEPSEQMISYYVQSLSGKNGDNKQKELLNQLPNELDVNNLIVAGFRQDDFNALIRWDRMNQPAGGPNWPNTRPSPSSTTNSTPQSPKATQTLTYSHGRYVGEVLDGKAHGNGSYTSARSGTVYTGQFIRDTFSGNGTMTWTNGNKFVGIWDNDIGVNGKITYPNGTTSNGRVVKGQFIPSPVQSNSQSQPSTPTSQPTPQSQPSTQQTSNVSINFSAQVQPKTGVEYRYWNDKNYQSNDKEVYLNEGNYKYLCENTKGVTKFMTSSSGHGNSEFAYLLTNGSFDNWDVRYDPSYKENKCRIEMTVSGMRNGNSRRVTVRGYVNNFIVNDKGNILAHSGQAY